MAGPPAGAPTIIVVLLDDMGFSDIGPFGAEVATPHLDRLAAQVLRYTNYHTAPVCSPARAAFLTGLNPHRAGFASVANSDPGFPGYTMEIAEDVPTLAAILRDAGYATFAVGKWHLTRDALMNDAAARRSWPCQQGHSPRRLLTMLAGPQRKTECVSRKGGSALAEVQKKSTARGRSTRPFGRER